MRYNMPNSPFAMSLSGSAKETELRIRNIFQWKKKRPPVIAFAAAVLVAALCGSLVGFAPRDERIGELVPGKNGVLAVEEIPGGVVYATGRFRSADLYWFPSGANAENAKLIRKGIPNVDRSTLTLSCEGDILRLQYLQLDAPFERNDLWVTNRYRVSEGTPPEYIDGSAILASMVGK